MTWFKVDDGFCSHPKVIGLDMAARGLWVTAGSWCAQQLTDGVIDDRQIRALGGTRKQAEKLVAAGLWSHDGAPLSARRYSFENWRDFQPTRDDVEAKRREARERMARARAKKAATSSNAETFARTDSERSREVRSDGLSERSHYPDPTRPDPTRPEVNTASSQPHGEQDASTESASSDPHHPAELAPTIRRLLTAGHSPAAIDTAVAAWIARPRPKGPGLLPHLVADAEATAEAGRAEAQKRELAASKRAATNACDLCDETGQILDDRGRPMAPAIHCTHDEDANAALVLDARQRAEAEAEAEAERRDRAAKAAAQARELRARLAEQRTSA
ncbi:hypothetical protein ACFORJ_01575 [Corynebacterium hansenii]|uniref:DNA-binding protein n=1 Tax=Corynebacterium hansenii TaxID=394964 RepID=A0ABV7ZJZ1_9CORY|nr:hypothetical protein [Corynebacterium hansenii]WJY99310.1 hypothetical protein CHAN_03410 [Corynebacterium hansenii]